MSKRKLNRRQKWRIEKIQAEKAARAEKKEKKLKDDINLTDLGHEQLGLVIAHYGQTVDIEPADQEAVYQKTLNQKIPEEEPNLESNTIHRCHVRANVGSLVTGDKVVWRAAKDGSGVIETRLDRNSLLQRPDNYGQLKPVAANIDRIIIVVATEPTPYANLIDRYLVAAETVKIKPAILFNKSDLINDSNREAIEQLYSSYSELGYEVLKTSAEEVEHCESTLLEWLKSYTSVFVGQSGVGKSSLIRSILGDQTIRVGALSEVSRKGTHTTTTAKLFHIPGGGKIVDSPGIREFGLWHINEQELLEGFIELRPHIGYCRFRDCKHINEPNCAIIKAYEENKISESRMTSYQRIRETLDDKETYS